MAMSLTVATVGVSSMAGTAPLVLSMATLSSLTCLLRPVVLRERVRKSPSTKTSPASLFSACARRPRLQTAGGISWAGVAPELASSNWRWHGRSCSLSSAANFLIIRSSSIDNSTVSTVCSIVFNLWTLKAN